ncbi:MAG: PAS domain S-box protein [Deltaproteobacteria bacterium]|nr:MAG: PAS domain S-box protein [Deltaproteobacteria bacterium]
MFGFALGKIITSAMHQNMMHRANEVAADFLIYEINNKVDIENFSIPKTGQEYQKLSRQIEGLNLGPDVMRIKIWNRDYTIVWATDEDEVGEQSPGHHELVHVYEGELISEISTGHHLNEKYAYATAAHQVMELYIPVRRSPQDEVSLVFEAYMNVDKLLADINRHNRIVWGTTATGTFLLYLVLFGLIWGASRQIDKQGTEIRLSEERFRSLIHSAPDGIVSADRSGRIFLINQAAEDIFGYEADEARNLSFAELFEHDEKSDFVVELKHFSDTGVCSVAGKSFEIIGLHKNGGKIPLEVSLSVSGEKDSSVLTAMIRDISQRNQMLEQIANAKQEWEETFDTINEAITIHDRDFNIIRANRAAEEMLGISLQRILGQKCFRSYHGSEEPPEKCPSCQTAQTGIESTTEIFEPNLEKYLEIKALPRFDEDKNLMGVVHVVRDITDKRKAEEQHDKLQAQLIQMQKMETVGRLAGGIAHDFNNILSAIIGYSELVLNDLPEDSEAYQDVETIKESGEKAAVLTGQLLAFSRKQVLKMQPVDLNKVIEGMAKMLTRLIGEKIQLELNLAQDISNITADSGQIEQIILNLAVNARDALHGGGHLIIETSEVELEKEYVEQHPGAQLGRHVMLALSDTGMGMSNEVKEQIFDPFFTTKERGKGTGLGLATVYGIVKQHESQIYVYSELGKGTTFKIFFPASETEVTYDAGIVEAGIPEGKETILLAEDDQTISRMIKNYLKPLGYNLLLAENGEEAIELSRSHEGDIQLLLTDVIMPKMDGQELANAIQNERPGIQVIFMSGYTDDVIAHHGVLDPDVNFIQKPITPSKLGKVLKEVLEIS